MHTVPFKPEVATPSFPEPNVTYGQDEILSNIDSLLIRAGQTFGSFPPNANGTVHLALRHDRNQVPYVRQYSDLDAFDDFMPGETMTDIAYRGQQGTTFHIGVGGPVRFDRLFTDDNGCISNDGLQLLRSGLDERQALLYNNQDAGIVAIDKTPNHFDSWNSETTRFMRREWFKIISNAITSVRTAQFLENRYQNLSPPLSNSLTPGGPTIDFDGLPPSGPLPSSHPSTGLSHDVHRRAPLN